MKGKYHPAGCVIQRIKKCEIKQLGLGAQETFQRDQSGNFVTDRLGDGLWKSDCWDRWWEGIPKAL